MIDKSQLLDACLTSAPKLVAEVVEGNESAFDEHDKALIGIGAKLGFMEGAKWQIMRQLAEMRTENQAMVN